MVEYSNTLTSNKTHAYQVRAKNKKTKENNMDTNKRDYVTKVFMTVTTYDEKGLQIEEHYLKHKILSDETLRLVFEDIDKELYRIEDTKGQD